MADRCGSELRGAAGSAAGWHSSVSLASAAAIALVAAVLAMPSGAAAGYQTLVETGPADNRVNIVFLGDGYTAGQLDTLYTQHIDTVLSHMFDDGEDPFPRYENFFNVYRVDVTSNESGADVPPEGIFRDTALDASYNWDGGPSRLLYVDQAKADAALVSALAGSGITADVKFVTVNDTRYGGAGGNYAVFAGGNTYAGELSLHEMGHSFSNLADEYVDTSLSPRTYNGPEPYRVNATKDPSGLKWDHWLGYVDALGTVGAYEGAMGYDYGLYRPTETSKMRQLGEKFNAVCREKIILDIYDIVDPIDDSLQPFVTYTDPGEIWVDLVDPNVIDVEWRVDDVPVSGASGETFSLTDWGFGAGTYWVTATAYDATEWIREGREGTEHMLGWSVELTPEPTSAAMLAVAAIATLRRRRLGA